MSLSQTQFIQGPVTPGGLAIELKASDTVDTGAITSSDLASGAVTAAAIAAHAVTAAKLNFFVANGKSGTGSSQSIAHGLGVIPAGVIVSFEGSTASQAVTYGSHTSTNIVVTVTSSAVFSVLAYA